MATSKKKGDALKVQKLPAKSAKNAGEVKGGMRAMGTSAKTTVCATGPKSEDCAC